MKKLLYFSLTAMMICFFSMSSFAQDDTKAKAVLDGASAKMKTYKTMKIEFTYAMANTQKNINESKTGTIQIKGNKYKLDISGQVVFCNGTTVWTYIPDDEEVNVNNASTQEDAINPLNLLNNYSANFKAKLIKEIVIGTKSVYVIDMTPLKGKSYYKVRLNIEKSSQQIVSTIVYDKNGSTYTITVTKLTTDLEMLDTMFNFNTADYPGVDVNDMR